MHSVPDSYRQRYSRFTISLNKDTIMVILYKLITSLFISCFKDKELAPWLITKCIIVFNKMQAFVPTQHFNGTQLNNGTGGEGGGSHLVEPSTLSPTTYHRHYSAGTAHTNPAGRLILVKACFWLEPFSVTCDQAYLVVPWVAPVLESWSFSTRNYGRQILELHIPACEVV